MRLIHDFLTPLCHSLPPVCSRNSLHIERIFYHGVCRLYAVVVHHVATLGVCVSKRRHFSEAQKFCASLAHLFIGGVYGRRRVAAGRVASGREERRENAEEQMSPRAAGANTLRGGHLSIEAHPGASKGSVEKALRRCSVTLLPIMVSSPKPKPMCCKFSRKAIYEA